MSMLRTSRIYATVALSLFAAIAMLAISPSLKAPNVNIEEVMSCRKKKPIKISGSIWTSASYSSAKTQQARHTSTYQVTGSVNTSV